MTPTPRDPRWSAHRHIPAPPEVVWRLLIDPTAWPRWGPTVSAATLDGDRLTAGARGAVTTAVGISLPFVITDFVPGRRWAWTVAGIPATTHEVEPADGGCRATMSAPLWAPAYLPVLRIALGRIDRMARRGDTDPPHGN
ncbi:SRPBCC family protein [Nocardia takedensis]|uniref:SRPBCC family protein n=1 Tax=Nocardia takedensis TaxID=259390 RepID=UPI0002F2F8A8|nr:SRPBCC family protein [Nocardia takedensis]